MSNESRNYHINRYTGKFTGALTLLSAQATTGASATSTSAGLGGPYTVFSASAFRATTGTGGGSTKPSWKLQGSIDNTRWFTIGAATRTVNSTAGIPAVITSTVGLAWIRASINNFTTSAGLNPDKVALTVKLLPVS